MKKFLIVVLLCMICMVLGFSIYLNSRLISDVKLDKFEPFSPNNLLLQEEPIFKISTHIPTIEAASAFYPFAGNLVQKVYDEASYSNEHLKLVSTSEAYQHMVSGNVDIIISTMPSDEQKKMIQDAPVSLEMIPLFKEPLVVYVNQKNNVNKLSISQIQDMYQNELSWKSCGGSDEIVQTYQLEKNNGSQTCFETIVKDTLLSSTHHEIVTMPQIIDKVGEDENGIGYAFDSYFSKMHINRKVKKIAVEGKLPQEEEYPLLFEVFFIYRTDNPNENIPKLVSYLQSEEGREFLKRAK